MLLEHDRNYDFGKDALVTKKLLEHERNYDFGMDALVTKKLLEHERNYDFGMDALVTVCSWSTNGIMILAWLLWSPIHPSSPSGVQWRGAQAVAPHHGTRTQHGDPPMAAAHQMNCFKTRQTPPIDPGNSCQYYTGFRGRLAPDNGELNGKEHGT